jgi:hypothetical protein
MARGQTVWDDEAKDIVKDCRRVQHCIQLWRQAIERDGEASRKARNIASDLCASLRSITWRDRRPREMPDDWVSLSSGSPELAAALNKLARAAVAALLIADAGWRKGTKPESWEWVDHLEQAKEALQAVIDSPKFIRDPATEARDSFIYDEWCKGTPEKKIRAHVNSHGGWDAIRKRQGISRRPSDTPNVTIYPLRRSESPVGHVSKSPEGEIATKPSCHLLRIRYACYPHTMPPDANDIDRQPGGVHDRDRRQANLSGLGDCDARRVCTASRRHHVAP